MRPVPLTFSAITPKNSGKRRVFLSAALVFRLTLLSATLAGFVLALILAASPELHERLHHDAGHQEHHECLATVLHAGGCDDPAPAPALATFVATLLAITPLDRSLPAESLFLSFRILEHAPPRRA